MKIILLSLIGMLIVIGSVSRVRAADSVNMGVTVVERKSTDTINDFDLSQLNNIAPLPLKEIKGASVVNLGAISCPRPVESIWSKVQHWFNR